MKKVRSILVRFRLLTNILALAIILGAFTLMPPVASADPGWICESGCIDWNAQQGCVQPITCCANSQGGWFCVGS
jgi:hypothetical protein